jgi:hypothetical protein
MQVPAQAWQDDRMADSPARPVLPDEIDRKVSLREFEQRLAEFQRAADERTKYEREILEARQAAIERAVQLADVEYKRRLDELNHAHVTAMENWRQSLPREVFAATQNELQKWRDVVNVSMATRQNVPAELAALEKRLDLIEERTQQQTGALTLIRFMGFAGVVALIVTFLRMAQVIP